MLLTSAGVAANVSLAGCIVILSDLTFLYILYMNDQRAKSCVIGVSQVPIFLLVDVLQKESSWTMFRYNTRCESCR